VACPASGHTRTKDKATSQAGFSSIHEHGASTEVQIPEIGRVEVAGEWLIPQDEVLVIGFGPHTVADKDGKAVVRERLAVITAEEAGGQSLSLHGTSVVPMTLPRPLPRIAAPITSPAPTPVPATSLPKPTPPSRTIPQGIHTDGTPAELPPLPEEEKPSAGGSESESSQPLPSPQTKKRIPPRNAEASQDSKSPASASADSRAARAAYVWAAPLLRPNALSSFGFSGLQFVMPLKPFSLKLPLSQKLELELIGRIVPDSESAASGSPSEE
jgi:hypothetical protein